jgi:tRNA dimethylallyltransferase
MNSAVEKPKIIVISGPTGIGKTHVAIHLAIEFHGEIISADSMQIYRYMDIGTAKPTAEERKQVPHHMIDIVDPDEPFDAIRFSEQARQKVVELHSRGRVPFVVGGTGLYIKALVHGIFHSRPVHPSLRQRLRREADAQGTGFLHRRLKEYDAVTAARLHPNDTYRIIRALETWEATGKSISEHHRGHRFSENPFNVLKIGLTTDRQTLYDRIDLRVDAMINAGFEDEVSALLGRGYHPDLKSMQSIGYRHLVAYLQGRLSWNECLRTLKRDTRRYAKRQLTWFGADSEIIWKAPDQISAIVTPVRDFIRQ